MRLFGLIGFPLAHSFSKKYFTEKFLREGLRDCRYELFPIEHISELGKLIDDHPELSGFNVTIPYKESVISLLDHNALLEDLPACNCVRIIEGRLWGYNTDHIGFEKSLLPLLRSHHQKALVLGNGGSSRAIVFVLRKLGIDYEIVSRHLREGSTLTYEDISEEVMKQCTLVINATPVGMYPYVNERPKIPYELLTPAHLLFDLVYNPEKTVFLEEGERRGATVQNGLEMLALQAEESWRLWTS
jgi:shikimate dehydrogenase